MKKCHDRGTGIETGLGQAPRLQGAAGHVKHLGRLALRDSLRVQLAIPCKEVHPFEASPALVAIILATLLFLS
jgi:hypothetical protein